MFTHSGSKKSNNHTIKIEITNNTYEIYSYPETILITFFLLSSRPYFGVRDER